MDDQATTCDGGRQGLLEKVSIAPMIGWTDSYWRCWFRGINSSTLLYTEMVQANALSYNAPRVEEYIGHRQLEHPLALQLGGYDPELTGEAAYLASTFAPWHSINLNCGCPSNKAKKAGYGAELMLEPEVTRQIVHAMTRRCTSTDITVKCRLGVIGIKTPRAEYTDLVEFIEACRAGGSRSFVIHARDVALRGLSPAQNRNIPPLRYDVVRRLCKDFPDLKFTLNGGIASLEQASALLLEQTEEEGILAGAMIGRAAYRNPCMFYEPGTGEGTTRRDLLDKYFGLFPDATGTDAIKPLHNLFSGCAHEKAYKAQLDQVLLRLKGETVEDTLAACLEACASPALERFLDLPLSCTASHIS